MYLERLLLGKVIGGEDYRKFHIFLGYKELVKVVKDLTESGESEFTKLRPNLLGIDPDDAFSIVPYEKGCLFLFFLELKVGGKENMLGWLNDLYVQYKMKTIDAEIVKENFENYFRGKVGQEALASIDWNKWYDDEGLPPFDPSQALINEYSIKSNVVIQKWINSVNGEDLSENDIAGFQPSQIMFCLDEVVTSTAMPFKHSVLAKMDEVYKFSLSNNVEISHRFIGLCLKSKFSPIVPATSKFLSLHGRGRYVKYLFNCLNEFDHAEAVKIWKQHSHRYHSVIHNAFAQKLGQ